MKRFILKEVERFRIFALLLVALCVYSTANALESDDINAAILVEGSVPVRWTNDAEHPWYLEASMDGSYMYIRTPETKEDSAFTSTLSFTYSSAYPTEITYDWYRYRYYNSEDVLTIVIDGEEKGSTTDSSWNYKDILIPAGSHKVEFISKSANKNYNGTDYYYGGIKNLRVLECRELESACLKEGSLPLTFENDPNHMWITENGYIRSTTEKEDGEASSKISTTFTIDRPSVFSLECRDYRNDGDNYILNIAIDGLEYNSYSKRDWQYISFVLYPGTHTIDICNWQRYKYEGYHRSEIRNVCLNQSWYEVTLNNPGELGTRLTQIMEGQPIQNMELLKIKGAMNADDWDKVKLLTGIKAIDFTETGITSIPDNSCKGLSYLSTVMLPETVKTIGNNAFERTNFYQIAIPASVETIGNEVWNETPLRFITFPHDSKLTAIGYKTFRKTRIMEFDMPDSVAELGYYLEFGDKSSFLFSECKYLERLHISEKLTEIYGFFASDCYKLTDVNIPANTTFISFYAFSSCSMETVTIPKNVVTIREHAFRDNSNLKEIYLNSHCWDMNYIFANCTALEKIVLPCATPPTCGGDPFSGVTKSNVTLIVPDFAFDTYRADSYWYNFTNTVKGDEASLNDYWALRGSLNLNNTLVMRGNPSVEMMEGSRLTFDSNSEQTFNEFTYNTSQSSPTVVLSQSNSVKVDRLISKLYVSSANTWFFFSPVTDVNMRDVSFPASDSWVIRYYDGARRASENATSGNWINVPSDGILKGGQGYIIQARSTGWLYLPAAGTEEHDKFFGSKQVTFELEDNSCETEANAGWNFVANPYPTYYDIYYIDMQAPITVWTGNTYRAYSLNDGDRGDDTFVLRPMQPFFVQKASADLTTGMPLVGRQLDTKIDRSRAPRPVVVDENRHKLNLELYRDDNENADDYTRVVLNESASMAYETVCDASKFMTMNPEVSQLYTLGTNGHPMAINERPYEDGNVALGVVLPSASHTYRIAVSRADRRVWLYDAETGIEQDLTEGDYIFAASRTGVDNKRFSLRFSPEANSADGIGTGKVTVTGNVGYISVTAPADADVTVYGTDGCVITSTIATDSRIEIAVSAGVYVVKVNGESYKTIVK